MLSSALNLTLRCSDRRIVVSKYAVVTAGSGSYANLPTSLGVLTVRIIGPTGGMKKKVVWTCLYAPKPKPASV